MSSQLSQDNHPVDLQDPLALPGAEHLQTAPFHSTDDSPAAGRIHVAFDLGTVIYYGEWRQQGDTFDAFYETGGNLVFHRNVEIVDPSQATSGFAGGTDVIRSWLSSDEYYECSLQGEIIGLDSSRFVVRAASDGTDEDENPDSHSTDDGSDAQTPSVNPPEEQAVTEPIGSESQDAVLEDSEISASGGGSMTLSQTALLFAICYLFRHRRTLRDPC